ncbi:hypothetical protein NSQ26_07270 [Bacillus sp. FSL W7-1360]
MELYQFFLTAGLIVAVIIAFKGHKMNVKTHQSHELTLREADHLLLERKKAIEKSLANQEILINEVRALREEVAQLKKNY